MEVLKKMEDEAMHSLDPRRHEMLEARIFGTGPLASKTLPTDSETARIVAERSAFAAPLSDGRVVRAPPAAAINELSNLSSAGGSSSDRELDSPDKATAAAAASAAAAAAAGDRLPKAPSKPPSERKPRKRRRDANAPADGETARTPKPKKITAFCVTKSSPQHSATLTNGLSVAVAGASAFQPGSLFTPISPQPPTNCVPSGSADVDLATTSQRITPPTVLCSYASSDSNQSPPNSLRASLHTQTDLNADALNDALTDGERKAAQLAELNQANADLRQQLMSSTRKENEQASRLERCRQVTKQLLVEQSLMERKQRKTKCMDDCLRLGQFKPERRLVANSSQFEEVWCDGYAFEDINKRLAKINTERSEISAASALLRKRKPNSARDARRQLQQADRGVTQLSCPAGGALLVAAAGALLPGASGAATNAAAAAASPADDVFVRPEQPKELSVQEYYEQDEIYRLRREQLKREESELQAELGRLDRERNLHIREFKRVQSEESSRYKDHQTLNNRYLLLSLLGKGGFSEVWRAYDLDAYRYVACKIHHVNKDWKEEKKANYVKHALREKDIHKTLSHPRIVRLYDLFTIDDHSFCTVLEYCDGNDLDFYLKQNKTIPEKEARSIIMQVVSALRYLRYETKQPVIHYDLKPANILLQTGTTSGELKITDFGLSKIMDDDGDSGMDLTSQGAGTYWYLPPECFVIGAQPPKINSKVDVWSVGVIFYQCLYGKRPFGHNQTQARILEENTILNATEVHFAAKPAVSQEAKNFIRACLQYRKDERADVMDLVNHEYLKPRGTRAPPSPAAQQATSPSPSTSAVSPFV